MTTVKTGSYQDADNVFAVDSLDAVREASYNTARVEEPVPETTPVLTTQFATTEMNILHSYISYIIHRHMQNCNKPHRTVRCFLIFQPNKMNSI